MGAAVSAPAAPLPGLPVVDAAAVLAAVVVAVAAVLPPYPPTFCVGWLYSWWPCAPVMHISFTSEIAQGRILGAFCLRP